MDDDETVVIATKKEIREFFNSCEDVGEYPSAEFLFAWLDDQAEINEVHV